MANQSENVVGVIDKHSYKFTLTEIDGHAFCHVDFPKWDLSVYKEILVDFQDIRAVIGTDIHCNIDKKNKKQIKLAKMFGFETVIETEQSEILRLKWEIQ